MIRFQAPNGLQHRDRSHLYSSTPPASGRSSPFGTPQREHTPVGQRFVDDLEGQNDEHLDGLTAKVKILKDVSFIAPETLRVCSCLCSCRPPQITIGIGNEVRESTTQLANMVCLFYSARTPHVCDTSRRTTRSAKLVTSLAALSVASTTWPHAKVAVGSGTSSSSYSSFGGSSLCGGGANDPAHGFRVSSQHQHLDIRRTLLNADVHDPATPKIV